MGKMHKVALALQGGGVHGAFTWGVLDALLDEAAEGNIDIVGVSGSSSGALTATALAYGFHEGAALPGPATARTRRMVEAARGKMRELWETVARTAFWGGNPFVAAIGMAADWNIDDMPSARWADVSLSSGHPTETGLNATLTTVLREVLPQIPAIFALPQAGTPMLVVAATDVAECRRQLFIDGAVSPDVIKATNAQPTHFQTATIGGRAYWDGGYMGNPPLTPLIEGLRENEAHDLLVVTMNPLRRDGAPHGPREILDRLNEVTFNSSLIHEVNAIETINRLIDAGMVKDPPARQRPYHRINLHRVHADEEIAKLGIYSKDAPAWDFLVHLRDLGRQAFKAAWPQIKPALGKSSSWDTTAMCDSILARKAITTRER
ncbi:alpha/beta hydrolase [Paramagnetospirillum kuznetsovii]|uniref:Alpha/beta hydrolase n=1 Tax=Paramagnetospirillum kuznetsovii TaxID=2053833 RepID=A0A364P1K9_9PROT|nr:patatin-like phospholipase family protein [Paramagnetospirillum kuznetsovii]RAU23222.1 alpha/beta hydrolase [Paramagnetospirillum kuznetsovii]